MKLTSLDICNFRSFGSEAKTIYFDGFTGIIGHNSAGKTTILNAINAMFGNLKLRKSDFHTEDTEAGNEPLSLQIKAKFEFFNVDDDPKNYSIPSFFQSFTISKPGEAPYTEVLFEALWQQGNTPNGVIETSLNYLVGGEAESKIPMPMLDRSKIDVIYIPAIRNPYDQLSNASGTILWRLLKQLNWKEEDKAQISEKIKALDEAISAQEGISLLEQTISSQWKTYHTDSRFAEASLKFGSTDLEKILKKLEVEFSPSPFDQTYRVGDLGDGLQSLFYFSLIDAFLKLEEKGLNEVSTGVDEEQRILNINPPAITLLLVEEPENHINPQLLGKALSNLKSISKNVNSQVIFTSHSPSVVKRVDPKNIRHIRMDAEQQSTVVNKITLPSDEGEAYKFVKGAIQAYPELYFSSLVIFGEGDSEELLIPHFLKKKFPNLDAEGISIVPLGGRHVNHFWRLLTMLKIPYITLLDFDQERYGGGWGRIQYALKELIKLKPSFGETFKLKNKKTLNEVIDGLSSWSLTSSSLQSWINSLEERNIYFSSPLDIDFLMLENFKDQYLSILGSNEGPIVKIGENNVKFSQVTEEGKQTEEYQDKLATALKHTLKEKSGDGSTFSDEQKELMVWYDYFFLGRGKPVTHRLAIDKIEELLTIPPVFERLGLKVETIVKGE
ncbi:AAA family ATPase [Enterococcus faecalis]|uniref:ATP-dependent nuclease n=1 Tax=Enterococcus faecalis TaxID=1351 RepID=UPI00338FF988